MNPDQVGKGNPTKILIVEDSATQAEQVRFALEEGGYEVIVSRNGREALEAASQHEPALILSDIVMPVMGGYELCRRVKSDPELRAIPVTLLTSLSDPEDVLRGLECGADNFIVKPCDETCLLTRVATMLADRSASRTEFDQEGVEVSFAGNKYVITANRLQILNLLLSTYETAVQKNQELLRVQEELRRTAQAKTEFLANMSHELRTPLNSIIGFSEVLFDETFGPLTEKQRKYVTNVLASGKHLLLLINELLDMAKVESGKMQLNLSILPTKRLLTDISLLVADQVSERKLNMELRIAEDLPNIEADELRVKQILFNLLSNAIKFTPLGGAIGMSADRSGSAIEIAVWDTGVGIAEENIGRVFEGFFRVDTPYSRVTEGTGLGLPLSKKLVELHGGTLSIESEGLNNGTTVLFTLPVLSPSRAHPSA